LVGIESALDLNLDLDLDLDFRSCIWVVLNPH